MTPESLERFLTLRRDLFEAIGKALERDGGKSYEGAMSIYFPNWSEANFPEQHAGIWQIRLDCYIIGPNRHYTWNGDTFDAALDACERDVRSWIADKDAED